MHDWRDDRVIVRNEKPEVLLTFDDGPTEYLPEILSILKAEDVQGLFFWQTALVGDDGSPWQRVLDEGHLLGSHAHSHPMLTELSYEAQLEEMETSINILEQLTGESVRWFRPPYGLYNEDTIKIAEKLNLDIVLWQVASWDWQHETNEDRIIENVREYTGPGDLVLLHELPQTVNVLRELIGTLRQKGIRLSRPYTALRMRTGM
ncbi:MAG TPA: polysaccharide deacetylase family protein [Bacillales bacterium]|nr:polysaccharide deacetylase family protein [Bacillales bacterium]